MARATVKETQQRVLEIYKEVKAICDRHGLKYYAVGGTAIGAVRHHGFIPWDDDLDIGMPSDDYFQFIEKYSKELPDHLQLVLPYASKNNTRQFIKVHDVRTTLILEGNMELPDMYYGMFVDIMPLYGVPDPAKPYIRHLSFLRSMDKVRRRTLKACRQKGKAAALCWVLAKPLNLLLPKMFWATRIERYLKRYTLENCKNTGLTWSNHITPRKIFPVEWFRERVVMPFEDTEIFLPAEYDKILTRQFGDYMTPVPPKDGNHMENGVANTDIPYLDYVKEFQQKGCIHQR